MSYSVLSIMIDKASKENHENSIRFSALTELSWNIVNILSKRIRKLCSFECMGKQSDFGFHIEVDEKRREFEVLVACYVSGLRISELAVTEGAYSQACCLLRQEIESLTQLIHVFNDTRSNDRAPNIKVLERQLKDIYSLLTGVAHLISKEDLQNFSSLAYQHHPADRLTLPMLADCLPSFKKEYCDLLLAIRALTMICVLGVIDKYMARHFPHLAMTPSEIEELKEIYNLLCRSVPEVSEHVLRFEFLF